MENQKNKMGPHWRIPWHDNDPEFIWVHCKFDRLKGTFRADRKLRAKYEEVYARAKRLNDQDAAAHLVAELVDGKVIDLIVDAIIKSDKPAKIVFPHPEFDSDEPPQNSSVITNAIPFAFAAFLATTLGGGIETEILECARPGRTKLNKFERFLWQPRFTGDIDKNAAYILVDDNCTLGGTMAMLRTHIVGNGGTVAAACALSSPSGLNCRFGIAQSTVDVLKSEYGSEISQLWIEEIGHDITCLTEGEGSFLAIWEQRGVGRPETLLDRLRARLDKAKATGK